MQFQISRMKGDDLDEVLAIEHLCFTYPFSRSLFESELNQPAATLLVARDGESLVGYIDFWKVVDEIHLINIAVHPDYQRKGIATQLFQAMLRVSPSPLEGEGGRKIYLEVRVSNEGAKKFYEKMGFQVIGIRKGYYPDGEDAYVLSSKITAF